MTFQVSAFRKSAITGAEIEFKLIRSGDSAVFVNAETLKPELGTYTDDANKFVALELFRKLSGDLSVRFELT